MGRGGGGGGGGGKREEVGVIHLYIICGVLIASSAGVHAEQEVLAGLGHGVETTQMKTIGMPLPNLARMMPE